MNRLNKEVSVPMSSSDDEGETNRERQTFMDVARTVFKQTGFGYLEWKNPAANVPSENTTTESVEYASSYAENSSTSLVRLLRGNFTPRYLDDLPARYELRVEFNNKTHDLKVKLEQREESHDSYVNLTLSPRGELLGTRSADYWYDQPYSSYLRRITEKREEEATSKEVELVLDDATIFLANLKERPEWQSKPKGPVYGGTDLAVVGG